MSSMLAFLLLATIVVGSESATTVSGSASRRHLEGVARGTHKVPRADELTEIQGNQKAKGNEPGGHKHRHRRYRAQTGLQQRPFDPLSIQQHLGQEYRQTKTARNQRSITAEGRNNVDQQGDRLKKLRLLPGRRKKCPRQSHKSILSKPKLRPHSKPGRRPHTKPWPRPHTKPWPRPHKKLWPKPPTKAWPASHYFSRQSLPHFRNEGVNTNRNTEPESRDVNNKNVWYTKNSTHDEEHDDHFEYENEYDKHEDGTEHEHMVEEGTEHEPAREEVPEHEPAGEEGIQHIPVGEDGTEYEPVGEESTGHEPAGGEVTVHEPVGGEVTGHEPAGGEITVHEPAGEEGIQHIPVGEEGTEHELAGEESTDYQYEPVQNNDGVHYVMGMCGPCCSIGHIGEEIVEEVPEEPFEHILTETNKTDIHIENHHKEHDDNIETHHEEAHEGHEIDTEAPLIETETNKTYIHTEHHDKEDTEKIETSNDEEIHDGKVTEIVAEERETPPNALYEENKTHEDIENYDMEHDTSVEEFKYNSKEIHDNKEIVRDEPPIAPHHHVTDTKITYYNMTNHDKDYSGKIEDEESYKKEVHGDYINPFESEINESYLNKTSHFKEHDENSEHEAFSHKPRGRGKCKNKNKYHKHKGDPKEDCA